MKNIYDVEPGEVFWAASDVGWVVGHSYIVYGAAAPRLHDDPLRGQAGRHARRRRLLARDLAAQGQGRCSPRRRPSAPSSGRIPNGELHEEVRPLAASRRCSSPASAATPTRCTGPRTCSGVPVIDHWWQTETGWAIAANCMGLEHAAGQAGLADQAGARLGRAGARRRAASEVAAAARSARSCVKLPLPPGTLADAVERRRALHRSPTSTRLPRLLPDRRRRLSSTRTATSTS